MSADDYRADLHVHSHCSDGLCTPEALLEEAQWRGLSCLGLTDHDTMSGVADAQAAGRRLGIRVLPGVELSCVHDAREIHILGYLIHDSARIENACRAIRDHRLNRMREMVRRAREKGLDITYEEVEREARGDSVGRPHLARVLINKGIVRSVGEAFDKHLGDKSGICVPKKRFAPAEAIQLIHAAGGVPVLAHPGVSKADSLIDPLIGMGLRGIEARYSAHSSADEQRYTALAKRMGLLVTGGSDYHGDPAHDRRLGQPCVGRAEVEALLALHERLHPAGEQPEEVA